MGQKIEAALYLHVPFCQAKCLYCSFYSVPNALDLVPLYLKALREEIRLWTQRVSQYRFVTFYVGGGTPSLLEPSFYKEFLEVVSRELDFSPQECTIEANPEGLTLSKLKAYRELGFNRFSLGAQSLDPRGLKILSRRHQIRDILQAIDLACRSGFENISLDLIFAWPGQDLKTLREELKSLLSLGIPHLSFYELTFEPGTRLYHEMLAGRISPLPEEEIVEMYYLIHQELEKKGFSHYEISNYARPGYQAKHNLFYWQARPFLGLGPAAASDVLGTRYKNISDLKSYLKALRQGVFPPREEERLSLEARFREAVVLGLRLLEGVSAPELKQRFGYDLRLYYGENLDFLIRAGFLEWKGDYLCFTFPGLLVANQIQARLV